MSELLASMQAPKHVRQARSGGADVAGFFHSSGSWNDTCSKGEDVENMLRALDGPTNSKRSDYIFGQNWVKTWILINIMIEQLFKSAITTKRS